MDERNCSRALTSDYARSVFCLVLGWVFVLGVRLVVGKSSVFKHLPILLEIDVTEARIAIRDRHRPECE